MRRVLATLVLLSPALLAERCPLPFAPQQGHTILYLHVLPQGSLWDRDYISIGLGFFLRPGTEE